MFPPPTTTATSTPSACTSRSCDARRPVASDEMPNSAFGGAKASPESFRRTRRYPGTSPSAAGGCASTPTASLGLLAQLESREAPDDHVLPDLRGHFLDQVPDRLRVLADVRLVEEHELLVVG